MSSQLGPAIIDPKDLVISVIDVQERLVGAMPSAVVAVLEKNLNTIAELARQVAIPVLLTEQYPKGLGPTLPALRERLSSPPIEKLAFSALGEPLYLEALTALSRNKVLLCGLEAHICVLQTALDLLSEGYTVHIAVDATASRKKLDWELGCKTLESAGAHLTTVESFAFRCLGVAGTPAFKAISRAIR